MRAFSMKDPHLFLNVFYQKMYLDIEFCLKFTVYSPREIILF